MLAFCIKLIFSLFLIVSGTGTFLAEKGLDDNEDMVSSADPTPDGDEQDRGGAPNLVNVPPKPFEAGFHPGLNPRPLPWQLTASHQWSRFLDLQRIRGSPSRGAPRVSGTLGFGSLIRPMAFPDDLPTRQGTTGLEVNQKNRDGLQIQKMIAHGVWEPALDSATKEHPQTKKGTEDKTSHGRWEASRQPMDDPGQWSSDNRAWASGAGPTEDQPPRSDIKPVVWGAVASPAKPDAQTRRRMAADAWRRVIEKGRGAAEEIVLPLTEDEVTRSNCRSVPFAQKVSHPSCASFTIQNRLCFGQCRSFFVPGPAPELYRSCSRCFPSRLRNTVILLECGGGRTVSKDVTLVQECQCDLEEDPMGH